MSLRVIVEDESGEAFVFEAQSGAVTRAGDDGEKAAIAAVLREALRALDRLVDRRAGPPDLRVVT